MASTGDAHETTKQRRVPRATRQAACVSYLVALCSWVTPVDALASVPGLTLAWHAPPDCPEAEEVERSIARLIGERSQEASRVPIDARVDVKRAASGRFQATVTLSGGASGLRHLDGASCSAIALASAVVIAVAVDPGEPPAPVQERPAPVEPARAKSSGGRRVMPFTRAFAGALFGALPDPAPQLGIGIGAEYGRFGTELTLTYAPETPIRVGSTAAGAQISRYAAAGSACFAAIAASATAFDVCLGGEVERYAAEAVGVSNPGAGSTFLFSPVATLKSRTRIVSRLSLVLSVTSVVRPFHPYFAITGVGRVYAIPRVGGALAGGLQLAF